MNRFLVAAASLAVGLSMAGLLAGPAPAEPGTDRDRVQIGQAAAPPQAAPQPTPPASSPPIYVPPRRGSPAEVAPAATRGVQMPKLKLLAPEHVGLTVSAQPTLYMYVAEAGRIQLLITRSADPGAAALASGRIDVKDGPGIWPVRLVDLKTSLEPGVEYRVTLMFFDRANSVRATESVLIQRVGEPPELTAMTAGAAPASRARTYASAGIWFDALDAVSAAIAAAPSAPGPRADRAALVEQAGLPEIAKLDR
ncbi:MAG: DUF928 domain-containing protein [Alphaproteobacteria bacterium]|nr:DUF928 domain-containing protein [Alphaproteobacteria bacterium]